jgi:hypothetical protein
MDFFIVFFRQMHIPANSQEDGYDAPELSSRRTPRLSGIGMPGRSLQTTGAAKIFCEELEHGRISLSDRMDHVAAISSTSALLFLASPMPEHDELVVS